MTKRTRLESLLPGITAKIDAHAALLAEADALIGAGMTKRQALILYEHLGHEARRIAVFGGNERRAVEVVRLRRVLRVVVYCLRDSEATV